MHCKSLWIKASANCINVMNDYAFRDLYISSKAESLNAAIAKKKKNTLDILRTISENYNKAYFVTLLQFGFNLSR